MRRLKVFGLAIMAVFVLGAVASQSAFAVAEPEFTVETKSTGTSGKAKFNLTGASIKCEKGSSTSSPTSKKLATGTLTFTSCTLGGEECHSLGAVAGTVLVTGAGTEYHLRRHANGDVTLDYLIPGTHIECKFEATTIVVKGDVLGLIIPILSDRKSFTVNLAVVGGAQEITQWENAAGEKVAAKLEGSINGGAAKAATMESAENQLTTELLTEIVKTN